MNTGALSIVLMAAWWPFTGAPTYEPEFTVGNLPGTEIQATPSGMDHVTVEAAMDQYRRVLELPLIDEDMRATATRRLADLHLRAGETALVDGSDGQADFQEAIRLYRDWLDRYPDRPGQDRVLYALAHALESSGTGDESMAIMNQLVDRYPESAAYPEAQFRRGETLFVGGDYDGAEAAYGAIVARGADSTFYNEALYKHAWSLFKQAEYRQAMTEFVQVIDLTLNGHLGGTADPRDRLGKAQRELVDDSLRVTAISASYMDGVDTLDQVLEWDEPPAWGELPYRALGELYLTQERFTDAGVAFGAFAERWPLAPGAPAMQQQVVVSLEAGGFPLEAMDARGVYVKRYGLDGPFWTPPPQDALAGTVTAQLRTYLTALAEFDHARYQEDEDLQARDRAIGWYARYIAFFPEDPGVGRRAFLLADLMFDDQRYREATDYYLLSAYASPDHADAAQAGYAALVSADRYRETLQGDQALEWELRHRELSRRFAMGFPEHPESDRVLARLSEDLYAAGEWQEAVVTAEQLGQRAAEPELIETSWRVRALGNFDLARYAKAEQAYLQLRALVGNEDDINERIAASIYRQGELARADGATQVAVSHFLRVGTTIPDSQYVVNARYDAAVLLLDSEQNDQGAAVLEDLRRFHPDHPLATESTRRLAVVYESSGRSAEAAENYLRIAELDDTPDKDRVTAVWHAAELYEQGGRLDKAAETYVLLMDRFPSEYDLGIEARIRLADMAGEAGQGETRQEWLESLVAVDMSAGDRRTDRSRYLAAQATLELAEPYRDAFNNTLLVRPLKDSLAVKKRRMEAALDAYGKASAYGISEVTTAATHQIGELYFRLAADLMASQRPEDLEADAAEQYDILLEEQAFPFEEKAIEIFQANAARAADGVYDQWVQASFARLAELMPARYGRTEKGETRVASIG